MSQPWPMVPLGEVLTQYQEYIESPEPRIYPKLSVKLYGKGVLLDTPADGATLKMKRHQIAKAGQIILSEIWGKKGAIGFVPVDGDGALCTSHFFLFDVQHDKIDPKWLQAIFSVNYLQEQLDAEAKGTTGYAAVRPKNLLAAKIPLPPLYEQKRLVARIEELAAKVEEARGLRRTAVDEVEALVDASFCSEVFQKSDYKPYYVAIGRADLSINKESRNPRQYYSTEFAYVDISSVDKGPSLLNKAKILSVAETPSRARRVIHSGDIIFSTVRPNLRAIAKIGPELDNQICSTGFTVFSPGATLDSDFLLHQLCSPFFIDQCVAKATGGHYPAINDANLRQVLIVAPPLPEQRRIVAYLDDLQTKVNELKRLQAETSAELDAMLPSILDMAFKGGLHTREALLHVASVIRKQELETTLEESGEVPMAEFPEIYPATDMDRAICAAALSIVEQSGTLSSMEYRDALFLATHPDMCKQLLGQKWRRALSAAMKSAPKELFAGKGQPLRWKECRDYLEGLGAIAIRRGTLDQFIHPGAAFASVKAGLPAGTDSVVKYALAAIEHVRELRKNLASAPQDKRKALQALDKYYEENKIPA